MAEQLNNQLQADLKFITNPDNYFAMFNYVIDACTTAEFINKFLYNSEMLLDENYLANAELIQNAKENAIRTHGEWTIKTLEQIKTKHSIRSFVSTIYADILAQSLAAK